MPMQSSHITLPSKRQNRHKKQATHNRKGGQALAVVAFYGGYVLSKLLKLSKFSFFW